MRSGVKFGDVTLTDSMMKDGLTDAFHGYHMGITAENIVQQKSISREAQDQFAALSQNKAEAAQKSGVFTKEIVAVSVPSKQGINQGHLLSTPFAVCPKYHVYVLEW